MYRSILTYILPFIIVLSVPEDCPTENSKSFCCYRKWWIKQFLRQYACVKVLFFIRLFRFLLTVKQFSLLLYFNDEIQSNKKERTLKTCIWLPCPRFLDMVFKSWYLWFFVQNFKKSEVQAGTKRDAWGNNEDAFPAGNFLCFLYLNNHPWSSCFKEWYILSSHQAKKFLVLDIFHDVFMVNIYSVFQNSIRLTVKEKTTIVCKMPILSTTISPFYCTIII